MEVFFVDLKYNTIAFSCLFCTVQDWDVFCVRPFDRFICRNANNLVPFSCKPMLARNSSWQLHDNGGMGETNVLLNAPGMVSGVRQVRREPPDEAHQGSKEEGAHKLLPTDLTGWTPVCSFIFVHPFRVFILAPSSSILPLQKDANAALLLLCPGRFLCFHFY